MCIRDRPVGLPVEIVPLSRPFGLYAGNTFRGKVLVLSLIHMCSPVSLRDTV